MYGGSIPLTRSFPLLARMQKKNEHVSRPVPLRLDKAIVCLCAFLVCGCAGLPRVPEAPPSASLPGKYHKIAGGQTLWEISRVYSIPLDTLVKINNISDSECIKEGQLLFIPEEKGSVPLPAPSGTLQDEDFSWPVKGRVISSFGRYSKGMLNKGIHIQASMNAPVLAARSGKIVFASSGFYGFGKTLIISHGDGLSTVYGRNSELLVKKGDYIKKGALIARVGRAGRDKLPYLHFEIRKKQTAQNPYFYLPG